MLSHAADFYVEGQVGHSSINDIMFHGNTFETGELDVVFELENSFAYGVEVGIKNFEKHNVLRVSLAWSKLDTEIKNAFGDLQGGTLYPAGPFNDAEVLPFGLDFTVLNSGADIYSANIYYDFPTQWKFRPYLGIGLGFAELENYESGILLSLGGEYAINDHFSWGLKYQHSKFSIGDDADLNWQYGSLKANVISGTLSYKF